MGYGTIADAKNWRRSLRHTAAYSPTSQHKSRTLNESIVGRDSVLQHSSPVILSAAAIGLNDWAGSLPNHDALWDVGWSANEGGADWKGMDARLRSNASD